MFDPTDIYVQFSTFFFSGTVMLHYYFLHNFNLIFLKNNTLLEKSDFCMY